MITITNKLKNKSRKDLLTKIISPRKNCVPYLIVFRGILTSVMMEFVPPLRKLQNSIKVWRGCRVFVGRQCLHWEVLWVVLAQKWIGRGFKRWTISTLQTWITWQASQNIIWYFSLFQSPWGISIQRLCWQPTWIDPVSRKLGRFHTKTKFQLYTDHQWQNGGYNLVYVCNYFVLA